MSVNAGSQHRALVSAAMAGGVALVSRARVPWRADDPILVLVAVYQPALYRALYVATSRCCFRRPIWCRRCSGRSRTSL